MSPRRPGSSTSSPPRTPSVQSGHVRTNSSQGFAPSNPSGLREAHTLSQSPEDISTNAPRGTGSSNRTRDSSPGPEPFPKAADGNYRDESRSTADEATSLLRGQLDLPTGCVHPGPCNHGTFSPRLQSRAGSISGDSSGASGYDRRERTDSMSLSFLGLPLKSGNGHKRKTSTTASLLERHGISNKTSMYLTYYVPFFRWIRQYRWKYLQGDLIAALTMSSIYLPMALSYASNLAHVSPINGLYSFVFNPLVYAILGSCSQMIVGPEAPGCLLVGSVVKSSVDTGKGSESDDEMHGRVAGVVTGMAGAVIFIAGLTRLGFLDSVLSRPFLSGFISAIGFVILVDQMIQELGLEALASAVGVNHGSSVDKLRFLFHNGHHAHALTAAVAAVSFFVIMCFREMKKRLHPRYPGVAYFPDRFIVVVLSILLTRQMRWDEKGLSIVGAIKPASGSAFSFQWPFQTGHMSHIREAMGTSFLIALLGFFESSVAAKSLAGGDVKDGIEGVQLSANRELVALGAANLVGACFRAVPAFGGYGRSKLNASTGGKTPMSNIFLAMFTVICILYVLPAFYYLPKTILSSMISVVGVSLLEEAPHDVLFFIKVRGYTELGLMAIIFASTIFYSLSLGIAIGIGLSLLSVIKHSTRPRIQIMGRRPGTNKFENAEAHPDIEFIEGCMIVKIPEPLTFANTGDLKNRLRRLEHYGSTGAHPALPRLRPPEHNRNIIFDIHGVTGLDGSGAQVLEEIVRGYRDRGVRVFFSRGPAEGTPIWNLFERSGILAECGGRDHFVASVTEALRLTEVEEGGEAGYADMPGEEDGHSLRLSG